LVPAPLDGLGGLTGERVMRLGGVAVGRAVLTVESVVEAH
jgi:hypothetical protein